MNTTTRCRRIAAAIAATAAIICSAAACGTETASDAPPIPAKAPAAQPMGAPPPAISADSAERNGKPGATGQGYMGAPNGRPIPIP
jgi:hypothetical protein